MGTLKGYLERLFNPRWEFILDDHSIECFINKKSVQLNVLFNSEKFLKDQSQYLLTINQALKPYVKGSLVRPVITVILKGELRKYKKSDIFSDFFIQRLGGRQLLIEER